MPRLEDTITGKPYWKDHGAACSEIAQLHGLLSRVAGVLHLKLNGTTMQDRIKAIEDFCALEDRKSLQLNPSAGAPIFRGEDHPE